MFSVVLFLQMGGTPFGGLGAPNMEQMAAMGLPGANMNPQVSTLFNHCPIMSHQKFFVLTLPSSHLFQALSADFLKLMQSMDPK